MGSKEEIAHTEATHDASHHHKHVDANAYVVPIEVEANEDVKHINLSWRSWIVVFVTCFA